MVISAKQREKGRVDLLFLLFQRVGSMLLLVLAIQYWIRLTGIYEGAQYRFDTMSEPWRFAASTMAVLLPAASLGLWGGHAWGVVLWIAFIALEVLMHVWLSDWYGRADFRVFFHLFSLVALLGFALAMRILANRK